MAVIQNTAIVGQIRGKLNGSQFNKARNANTLQSKAMQSKATKGFQSEVRASFQFIQRFWKELLPNQKQAWQLVATNNPDRNRFGDLVVLSGYNKYMQAYMRSLYAGDWLNPREPFTGTAPSVPIFGYNVNFGFSSDSAGRTRIVGNITLSGSGFSDAYAFSLEVSLPHSAGVTTYYGRYSSVTGAELDVSFPLSFNEVLGGRYPLPVAGEYIQFRIRVYYTGNGVQVYEAFQRNLIS